MKKMNSPIRTLNKKNNSWFWDFDENDNKENKSTHNLIL